MTDIRTSPIGMTFEYIDLIDSTQAVWGGVSWPCGENIGSVTVVGALKTRYPNGYELAVLEEGESFDVRAMVRQIEALDLKYWVSWPRQDQRGAPHGRWIGDETHQAAKAFLREASEHSKRTNWTVDHAGRHEDAEDLKQRQLRLRPTPIMEMEMLYEYLLPRLRAWLEKDRKLLYLKEADADMALNQFESLDASDTSGLKAGDHPVIEALGYVCIELQRWLKSRDNSRLSGISRDVGKMSLHEV